MVTSATLDLEYARARFQSGEYDAALIELYKALWDDVRNPEAHLLLWDILEAQRFERERLTLLRDAIEEVAFSRRKPPPDGAARAVETDDADAPTRRTAPRFPLSRPVILVATPERSGKMVAELAVVEVTSVRGAGIRVRSKSLETGEKIFLFGTSGEADETIAATIRNVRAHGSGEFMILGVEFAAAAGKWLLPDDVEATASPVSEGATEDATVESGDEKKA
jgi:hypothetical protein